MEIGVHLHIFIVLSKNYYLTPGLDNKVCTFIILSVVSLWLF